MKSIAHSKYYPLQFPRWRITSLPSKFYDGMPGVGFPRSSVELLKIHNVKRGKWKIEYSSNGFTKIEENILQVQECKYKKQDEHKFAFPTLKKLTSEL